MHRYPWLHEELINKAGVTKDFKPEWNWHRYFIGGKMYAAVCVDDKSGEETLLTLKLEPLEGDFLRKQYEDIIPGYYMNKTHWNSVRLCGNVPDEVIRHMIAESYRLIAASLPKKTQKELNLEV